MHTIYSVRRGHLGRYSCEIKNVMGVSTCQAHLMTTSDAPAVTGAAAVLVGLLAIKAAAELT